VHVSDFNEGVALIVGGSGGIGSEIARALAEAGSDIAVTYRGNVTAAEEVAAEVRKLGRKASVHRMDLGDVTDVKRATEEALAIHGKLHTVVVAAGASIPQPRVHELDPETFRKVMDADVNGFFYVVHATLPKLRETGGSYVFMSSAGLDRFPPGDVLSVAPKGAIEALLRAIAREEGRFGVRANSVGIGVCDAGMFHRLVASGELDQAWIDASKKNIALRRFGSAREIADAAVFLASNRARYVTGQRLMVDGGYAI
jgi:NAD(P)-dependent dehydrogenase (short-subunit alcohol dehydrogenase family)